MKENIFNVKIIRVSVLIIHLKNSHRMGSKRGRSDFLSEDSDPETEVNKSAPMGSKTKVARDKWYERPSRLFPFMSAFVSLHSRPSQYLCFSSDFLLLYTHTHMHAYVLNVAQARKHRKHLVQVLQRDSPMDFSNQRQSPHRHNQILHLPQWRRVSLPRRAPMSASGRIVVTCSSTRHHNGPHIPPSTMYTSRHRPCITLPLCITHLF